MEAKEKISMSYTSDAKEKARSMAEITARYHLARNTRSFGYASRNFVSRRLCCMPS